MRVAVFNGPGRPITIERVGDPRPAPDELVVRIARCGICGSDVSMTSEGPFAYAAGRRLGHEYAGEVVDIGGDVTGVKVGDRVACMPIAGCGKCEACYAGRPLLCTQGKPMTGGFADYIAVHSAVATPLPRSLSLADGALIEPMACGLHALRLAGMRAGARVLVLGAGSMALSIVYWARLLGARAIVVASRSAHRSDVALAMGAHAVHSLVEDEPEKLVRALGGAADFVAECIGKSGMLNKAIDHVREAGTVISMGMCLHAEPVIAARCAFKEVRMLFPLGYSIAEFVETANAFDAGQVRPEIMVNEVIGLESFPTTIEQLRGGATSQKIQVNPMLDA